MSDEARAVTVSILDKDYNVACTDSERAALLEAVDFLDGRMRELREGGRLLGAERVAVMTALNIVHEYLQFRRNQEDRSDATDGTLRRLDGKLAALLKQTERGNIHG
jgi:cell division protein ZapA